MHWPNLGKLAFTLDLCLLPRPDIQLSLSSRFPSRHCKPILGQLRHLFDVTPPPSFPPALQYFYPLVQNNFAPLTCGDGIPPKLTMKSTPSSSSRSRRRRRRSKTPSPSTMARGLCSQGRRRLGELKMILTPFEGFPPHKIMMGLLPHRGGKISRRDCASRIEISLSSENQMISMTACSMMQIDVVMKYKYLVVHLQSFRMSLAEAWSRCHKQISE